MDIEILHKLKLTTQNLKNIMHEYNTLKVQNAKLLEQIKNLKEENIKIENNLRVLKKLIASNDTYKPLNLINKENAIDIKQKINKFVNDIDECISILSER